MVASAALLLALSGAFVGAAPKDLCFECHQGLTGRKGRLAEVAHRFAEGVHRARGFTCADCHGGDPTFGDVRASHDPAKGFRGVPRGKDVIKTCARCHSDPVLMKRYNPSPRVDQETEYWTSRHGKLLKEGDIKVATCISCHDVHGIRKVKDPNSPVYPLNVASTCARCHGSSVHMKGYRIPTDQIRQYGTSVHYQALVKKRDFGAPTCNKCHGNHGAAPPGVGNVVQVCGQCHAFFAKLFNESPHAGKVKKGCVTCHGNHAVLKPTDDWLGAQRGQACAACHTPKSKAGLAAAEIRKLVLSLKTAVTAAGKTLHQAEHAGLEVRKSIFALRAARDKLTQARKVVHSLKPKQVQGLVAAGLKVANACLQDGEKALAQIGYRRSGLLIALGALALVVFALWLKLRSIERTPV